MKTLIRSINNVILIYFLICGQVFAQTASLLPNALQQFFDVNGNPLSSGTVAFYIPNTSTFSTTWQDAGETIPNTNPVVLDAAGRAQIYGYGPYREVVKDVNGNLIWDQVTSSTLGPNTATAIGDGAAVGSVKAFAGITAPAQYAFSYGQALSRTTYSALLAAITQTTTVTCQNGSPTITGLPDTTQIPYGANVELSCVIAGTTVLSKTSSTVTLSNNSSVNLNAAAIFYPFGNGDGSTTFNVPDLRGLSIAGRDNMGGSAKGTLTSTYFGTNPDATGATGGNQSFTFIQANLPALTLSTTIASGQGSHLHSTPFVAGASLAGSGSPSSTGVGSTNTGLATLPAMTGTTPTGGSGVPIPTIQPTVTLNYIIKVFPDTSITTSNVVTSIAGQTGPFTCGSNITCIDGVINTTTGGGGTVSSGSTNQLAYYSTSGTTLTGLATAVLVAQGGTGATSAGSTAANNIGALAESNNLSDLVSVSTARTNLGLGAAALIGYTASTWTPVLTGTGGTANIYTNQVGSYEQIGRQVIVRFSILTSTLNSTGAASITGLPVTSANVSSDNGTCTISQMAGLTLTASYTSLSGTVAPNSTTISIIQNGSGQAGATITLTGQSAATALVGSCIYHN